ncbi:MAG TPA: tetratricopeptide repeat protein [Thermoanaerobaculia bacterium]|nr:tetratricopeptide repeat protein [Thermoanaerobaculia bacterium]
MKTTRSLYSLLAAALLLLPATAFGSGIPSIADSHRTRTPRTPESEAVELFNAGISFRDKAEKLEHEAAAEPEAKKKEKLEQKAVDKHESSIQKFVESTQKNPKLFQAWGSLGYAYRRTGKYPEALAAYDKALAIEQGYTPAIEYRAEAFLALNRLDDVKSAYMMLFRMDRVRADELFAAIEKWVQKKRTEPGSLGADVVENFAGWAAERKQLGAQTSSLLSPRSQSW